jgi:hypothetical protein
MLFSKIKDLFKGKCHKWGGSGIEKELFEWILQNLDPGSIIIELGSGDVSTRYLGEHYKLFSIEQNKEYLYKYNATYIYAPIENGWYDINIVKKSLPSNYDMIFVDGPSGSGNRSGFADNINIFNPEVPIVFHDTNREK